MCCPICLEELNNKVITTCNHEFCKKCIETWLENKFTCPMCRFKLKEEPEPVELVIQEIHNFHMEPFEVQLIYDQDVTDLEFFNQMDALILNEEYIQENIHVEYINHIERIENIINIMERPVIPLGNRRLRPRRRLVYDNLF